MGSPPPHGNMEGEDLRCPCQWEPKACAHCDQALVMQVSDDTALDVNITPTRKSKYPLYGNRSMQHVAQHYPRHRTDFYPTAPTPPHIGFVASNNRLILVILSKWEQPILVLGNSFRYGEILPVPQAAC